MSRETHASRNRIRSLAIFLRSATPSAYALTYPTATETQNTYRALKQPPLNPPAWLFGPVWTSIYATMGYVAHRAWTTGTTSVNPATVSLAKQGGTYFSILRRKHWSGRNALELHNTPSCLRSASLTDLPPATLYTIQLGLNLIWMPLFFGINRPRAAVVDILALGGTVSYLTYIWGQVDEVSGWLLAPYLGWLGFATYLNVSPRTLRT